MEILNLVSSDMIHHYNALCESIPLYPLHTEQDYDKAVIILNALLDAGGADEHHPLARLVESLGVFIEDYENYHLPSFS
jgi:HTH-type transcriptional regulator/antitoxin HigA